MQVIKEQLDSHEAKEDLLPLYYTRDQGYIIKANKSKQGCKRVFRPENLSTLLHLHDSQQHSSRFHQIHHSGMVTAQEE